MFDIIFGVRGYPGKRSYVFQLLWGRLIMLNFDSFEVITFDCYGTLIDWETGIWEALEVIFLNHRINMAAEKALELYGELESEAERGHYQKYRNVLRMVLKGLCSRVGFLPTEAELRDFSESVKEWPPFPDSVASLEALKRKYKLAIISNIDDDLFTFSAQRLRVQLDWIITAEQARSYKPSFNNFHLAINRIGVPQDKILHVAQSLYHDIIPAKTLGLRTVWINRRRNKKGWGATPAATAQPDLELPDLQTLAQKTGVT